MLSQQITLGLYSGLWSAALQNVHSSSISSSVEEPCLPVFLAARLFLQGSTNLTLISFFSIGSIFGFFEISSSGVASSPPALRFVGPLERSSGNSASVRAEGFRLGMNTSNCGISCGFSCLESGRGVKEGSTKSGTVFGNSETPPPLRCRPLDELIAAAAAASFLAMSSMVSGMRGGMEEEWLLLHRRLLHWLLLHWLLLHWLLFHWLLLHW